ncbi:hypothetical protein NLX83_00990 [Allokutzneria sp. A3M-2-11 16]|uniref:hypothetical protein n=1 Tax=Allokutzneria sp. A3M-2-11 16 TaxID=2962043 RepID=UPI0020B769E7|nr:hypothetical protein [Allokutzneria sp. A3M-2-11 16]MCP3797825.1 hypothetical protein [Allokutzneria sp. A3M-2-11 16]
MDAQLMPVLVPDEVKRYHPAVSALRKAKLLELGSTVLPRAVRILHAIATEAEQRGFSVKEHLSKTTGRQTGASKTWHLLLTSGHETVPLRIEEETDRVEHVPTPHERKEQQRHSWMRIPTHDHVASGRLRIEIGGQSQLDRKANWADRASWSLEEKLPELLREISVRADELRLRREAKARAEVEHQQAVEREQERARARAAEAHRREVLEQQLTSWRAAKELRTYAVAVAAGIAAADAADQESSEAIGQARQWLAWINNRADHLDPTKRLAVWLEPPELPYYELQKFMNRVPETVEMRYQPEQY